MAMKLSKENRRKISATLEREEEERRAQRKAMDERELRKLTTQARLMKEAKLRDAVTEKQIKVKDILSTENDNLLDNLKLIKSRRQCIKDTKQTQDIANLFAQKDDLDAAIALEKKHIEELQSEIQKDSKSIYIVKKRKGDGKSGGDYLITKDNERAERCLKSWNSRLEAEQTQLSLIIKENEEMRNKIQHLLMEKSRFNSSFEQLMAKLSRGKGIMADIVEQSRQQFLKRDDIIRKIEALRSRDKVDLTKRMEEMQDLEIKLYEDKRLANFRQRVQLMREHLNEDFRMSYKNTLEQRKLNLRMEKATKYFDTLKETTGLNSVDEICKYIITEDSNLFTMFNFNNEVRAQLDVSTYKTIELMNSINEESEATELETLEIMKKRDSMGKRLSLKEHHLTNMEDVYNANTRLFNRLLNKIKILFDMMGCKTSTLQELLGNNREVTEFNFRLYLEIIESKLIDTIELIGQTNEFVPSSATSRVHFGTRSDLRTRTVLAGLPSRKLITRPCTECESGKYF